MRFAFSHMYTRYELSDERSPENSGISSRAGWEMHAALRSLVEKDPGLYRLRSYLALDLHWIGLDKRSPSELLAEVYKALSQGRLRMITTRQSIGRAGAVPAAAPEPEAEWVEQTGSGSDEPGETAYAVDAAVAAAIAAGNREMAGDATALKEICPRPDCPVCHAQLALIGS
jgi:hypothetical protein